MTVLSFPKDLIEEAIYWENMTLTSRLRAPDFVRSLELRHIGALQQLACVFLNNATGKLGRCLKNVLANSCPTVKQTISRLNDKNYIESLEACYYARIQQACLKFLQLSNEYLDEVGGDTREWLDVEYRD